MKILCAGGGSGGHVTPVVAVLDELKKISQDEVVARFVCDHGFASQARSIMSGASVPVTVSVISAGKFRRYRHFGWVDYIKRPRIIINNIVDVFRVIIGFFQSLVLMVSDRPDVVFAKGGFVCLPVGWAARVLRIPVVIHDSDARPGLTNRLLAPFAQAIATGYPLENYPYEKSKSTYVGVPIRAGCTPVGVKRQATLKAKYSVDASTVMIVAFGGGLGSRVINEAFLAAARELHSHGVHIVLVAGVKHYSDVLEAMRDHPEVMDVLEFVAEGMVDLLGAADIVVTRASATSLQELAGLEKTVIAVPARQLGDQHKNAEVYREANAAVVLNDEQLEAGQLLSVVNDLISDPRRRHELAANLHAFARPDAATDVARLLLAQTK